MERVPASRPEVQAPIHAGRARTASSRQPSASRACRAVRSGSAIRAMTWVAMILSVSIVALRWSR
ncbi:hypothetical protein BW733_05005 [Tessaracoccus flavescens]|uniref:Uncharacterized protein n=1 Tax=Tessaracoccus flavescens TaxID=399497 RepID=A0A1Q2CVZ6_9ACTN|nr:hypothetical protein BW733_05005 [Tessaracoccus flavescens]